MTDRTPKFPGRVQLTPVSGQENVYDMTRADEPVEVGTPINKKTLLTDETAYLLEMKDDNPTPDLAFAHIAKNFVGDGGMNINLLEEAINMKYCKVLTLQEDSTAQSVFLSDAVWSLGCKSTEAGWSVVVKNSLEAPTLLQFQSTLADGTVLNFNLETGANFFYSRTDATAHCFYGSDGLCVVQNKPNEVCLLINGYTTTYYPNGTSTTSYSTSWRIWAVFDATTGEKKSSTVAYYTGSTYVGYTYTLSRASLWCYYNATYNYYYAPWHRRCDTSAAGYLSGLPVGREYCSSSYDTGVATISSLYLGTISTDSYYAGTGFFVNDTTFLSAEVRPGNVVYVYKSTMSSATSVSKSTLAYSTSIPTFSGSSWGYLSMSHLHMLRTESDQLYLYCTGQASTTTTTQYYVINRYGPFTINTTSITEAEHYTRLAGFPSSVNYSYIYLIANRNNSESELLYCLSQTMSSAEIQYFQVTGSTEAYRAISPCISSNTVDGRYINGLSGMMRPISCCDNSLQWMFIGSSTRIAYFQVPDSSLVGVTRYWTCPEDGKYKIIMVGGGAAGGSDYGGGSGYLKVTVKQYYEGDNVPYSIGMGQSVYNSSYSWMYRSTDRSTKFDDEIALCGSGASGGANGYCAADGGGGGGYNLVSFGGSGQAVGCVPRGNGGQGTVVAASGYGAGGAAGKNGSDGVIVILR